MRIANTVLPILLLAASTGPALAQTQGTTHTLTLDAGASPPAATIQDVAWVAGHWRGLALGGTAEEVWSEPLGGAMMGMFRFVRDGHVGFYEILSIAELDGSLILRLKHFESDLVGWEEKDKVITFPLVRLDRDAAYFDGLTFERDADGGLAVHVVSEEDGEVHELAFQYHRVDER